MKCQRFSFEYYDWTRAPGMNTLVIRVCSVWLRRVDVDNGLPLWASDNHRHKDRLVEDHITPSGFPG